MVVVEVCVESVAGAVAAERGGAGRVELCAGLLEGGTTPSAGALTRARAATGLQLVALIRPRPGDFLYDREELAVMEADVRIARELGADGVALGVLTPEGTIDLERTARLVERARPLKVTFHRAFDLVVDPFAALEDLVRLGVERLLTAGQESRAMDGLARLADLVARAQGRIAVVPGGGIRVDDVGRVLARTGAQQIHVTARAVVASRMRAGRALALGSTGAPAADLGSRPETDEALVRRIVQAAG